MKKSFKNFIRQKEMRIATVTSLLDCIACGTDTKRKIMEATGFSWGSVATYTAELLNKGVICEYIPENRTSGGRRTSHYKITGLKYQALGIEVSPGKISFALVSADGTLLESYSSGIAGIDNSNCVDVISQSLSDYIDRSAYSRDTILETVVSLTGAVDSEALIWHFSPGHPGINGCDLAPLRRSMPGNFSIEHDIFSKARSILFRHRMENSKCVFLHVGEGIGLAAGDNGVFYRGSRGFSGEIGHIPYGSGAGNICRCGKTDCLECSLSLPALRQNGKEALERPLEFLCVTAVNLFDPECLAVGGEAVEEMLSGAKEYWERKISSSSWLNAPQRMLFYKMSDCMGSFGAALGCRSFLIRQAASQLFSEE